MNVPLAIVAAVARNGIIGNSKAKDGLPWHLASDLKRFRALTMGKPLIMGRKTFALIGRPLKGREAIVVTRDRSFRAASNFDSYPLHIVSDLEAAVTLAAARAQAMQANEIIVAGGSDIFAGLIERVATLHLTLVDVAPEGDATFPAIDWTMWVEIGRETPVPAEGDDAPFSFIDYARAGAAPP